MKPYEEYTASREAILKEMKRRPDHYVTCEYISHRTQIDFYKVKELFMHDIAFSKSIIKGSKGQDVYYQKTRFGRLKDIWNAFCHINAWKYR